MVKNLSPSFINDLAKIVNKYDVSLDDTSGKLGNKVAEAILKEIESICNHIRSLIKKPILHDALTKKYLVSKILPQVYLDKGCHNSNHLFFEHTINLKGGIASVGFYLPCLFTTKEQIEEMCSFTKNGKEKCANPKCIEFYFALYSLPEKAW